MRFPKFFCCALLFCYVLLSAGLAAQAPTDEWRRPGMDAMVAEPGQASSILSNPAGIKTQEERSGKKHEWIIELITLDTLMTPQTWELLGEPDIISAYLKKQIDFLEWIRDLSEQRDIDDPVGTELLKGLSQRFYDQLRNGTSLPANQNDVTQQDLRNLPKLELKILVDNLRSNQNNLLKEFSNILKNSVSDLLGSIGTEHFSRTFGLAHVNDNKDLAWGFYLGLEQKLLFRYSKRLPLPIDFTASGINFKTALPLSFQSYVTLPIRVAFAHEFGLPGFSFGIGLKTVPYFGFNQDSLGKTLSRLIEGGVYGGNVSEFIVGDRLENLFAISTGLDFGMQYHFGAITPKLEFLHAGLKISDIIGFNISFASEFMPLRYAIDFDFGVYAEQQLSKVLQLFGGAELIQIRGMFAESSPYSALIEPIEHLRLLAGIALFDNVLRVSLQYYNNSFSPSVMLNLGSFQMSMGAQFELSESSSLGFTLGVRFRSPHNGLNQKTPYETYAQRRAVRIENAKRLQEAALNAE